MKNEGGRFDDTMEKYDGMIVCELIGSFMLYLKIKKYNLKLIGLYRDDEPAVFKNLSGAAQEKIKKHLQFLFKQISLQIIIACNL